MSDKENAFRYTYSAGQQEEIRAIRKKYMPPEEDKMAQLRRLDASAESAASTAAIVTGVVGALILGTGMSLIMTDFGRILGAWGAMIAGIVTGVLGIVLICLAYPVYNRTLRKARARIAPEVLRLTDELLK
ncbi:MAG: hypothetical protein IJY28_06635, partial [Clostridia bacterium]|nr:hypothetical protein [Clostridia bacterium]